MHRRERYREENADSSETSPHQSPLEKPFPNQKTKERVLYLPVCLYPYQENVSRK